MLSLKPPSSMSPPSDVVRSAADGAVATGSDVTGRAGLFFSESAGDPLRLVVQGGRLRVANGLPPLLSFEWLDHSVVVPRECSLRRHGQLPGVAEGQL